MSRYRDDDDMPRGSRERRGGYDETRDERGGYGGRNAEAGRGERYGAGREDVRDGGDHYYRTDYAGGAAGERRGERSDYDPRNDYAPRVRRDRYEDDERGQRDYDDSGAGEREPLRAPRRPEEGGRRRRGASRSHVRCRDIMTRDVTVATRATTLAEVARLMKNEDTGVIPVVDRETETPDHSNANPVTERMRDDAPAATPAADHAATTTTADASSRRARSTTHGNGRLVGLITDRDIVVRAIAAGRDPHTTRAEEIMTEEVHTAQLNDRVIEAIRKMGDKQVRRIPIVDQERTLRGIISMADVALETNDDRELAEALEEISSGSSFWNRIFGGE